jgi:hypothetical protein
MNDTVEATDAITPPSPVDLAEAAVTEAKATADAAVTALKTAKQYTVNVKTALDAIPDDEANAANRAQGQAALVEANAAEEAAKQNSDAAKVALKATRDNIKTVKTQMKEAAKAAREEAKAAKAAQKSERVKQNGILHPIAGSKCGQAWAIFDQVSAAKQAPAPISECIELAEKAGLSVGNVRAEYGQWRKFHGIGPVGRAPKPAAEPAAPATEPAAPPSEAAPATE